MASLGVAVVQPMTDDAGTVEVHVRALAAGGAGVAELPDGRVVFVHRTAPGDRARIRVEKAKARWAVGSLAEVLEPGPGRREPLCSLYARCGGCQLQHLPYEEQLVWKGRFVSDALERLGGLGPIEPPEVVPSPSPAGYRNRVTLTLRRLRGGRVVAGFHALGRPAHVLDVHGECVLPEPAIVEAWVRLRAAWGPGAQRLPAGGRLRLTLRAAEEGVELVVEGGTGPWDADGLRERAELAAAYRMEDAPPSAAAFRQVNEPVAEAMVGHVAEVAGPGPGRAIDAYCGAGAFGRALADRGWSVDGIELDPAAVRVARDQGTGDGGGGGSFRVLEGRVEALLPDLLPADLVIVNPPRSGMDPDAVSALAAAPPQRLVYVSCDPATLARDVEALSESHRLSRLKAFDLFPQTAHVETVAMLERRGDPA